MDQGPHIINQQLQNQLNSDQMHRNMGGWSQQEQKKYVQFLSAFRKVLQSRQQRRNTKIFKQMAQFVGSRDGIQCRSHHIKQLRTHRQIRRIIEYYKGEDDVACEYSKIKQQQNKKYGNERKKELKNQVKKEQQNEQKIQNRTQLESLSMANIFMVQYMNNCDFFCHFPCYQSQFVLVQMGQNALAGGSFHIWQ